MKVSVFYAASSYEEYYQGSGNQNVDISILDQYFSVNNIPPVGAPKYEEFMSLIAQKQNDALMAWRGGKVDGTDTHKSSIELVAKLTDQAYDVIARSKKYIVGRSDISYLLCSLQHHNIKCFYGPNITTFLESNDCERQIAHQYMLKALSGDAYTVDIGAEELNPDGNEPWTLSEGICTGRISGGNLDTICKIVQSKGWLKTGIEPGDILLLEEVDPYYVYNNGTPSKNENSVLDKLILLKENGLFDKISGLIIGRSQKPYIWDPDNDLYIDSVSNPQEKLYLEKLIQVLDLPSFPVVANVSCSHTNPMITLPLGRIATLDTFQHTISFDKE